MRYNILVLNSSSGFDGSVRYGGYKVFLAKARWQSNLFVSFIVFALLLGSKSAFAQMVYTVQAGDVLTVSVWKEPELTGDVAVLPDGTFSVPLIGAIQASGRTIKEIQNDASKNLSKFIPEPVVTIGLRSTVGKQIYVLGQVTTPGVFTINKPTDVMQALSLAQGMTSYASANKIRILRRKAGKQLAIRFRYGDVEKGENLEQNIVLQDGDTVVVP